MKTSPASILIFCTVLFIFIFQPGFVLPLSADTRAANASGGTVLSGYTGTGLPSCSYEIFSDDGNYNATSRTISVSPAGQTVPVTVSYADFPCAGSSDLSFSLGTDFVVLHPLAEDVYQSELTGTQIILRSSAQNRLSCDEWGIAINPSDESLYVSSPFGNALNYIEVMNTVRFERCNTNSDYEIVYEIMNLDAVYQGLGPFLNVNVEKFSFEYNGETHVLVDKVYYPEVDFLGDTDPTGEDIATYEDLVERLQAALDNYIAVTDSIPAKPWTTDNNDHEWIYLSPADATGNGSVTIIVGENMQNTSREGKISIAGQEVTIKQDPLSPCSFDLSSTQAVFSPGGQTILVDVVPSSYDCAWSVSRPDSLNWALVSPTAGIGSGRVSITTSPSTGDLRQAEITIAENTFTITQGDPSSCNFQVSSGIPLNFTASAGSRLIQVTAIPDDCAWTASDNNYHWIRAYPTSQTTGSGVVTLSVTPNPGVGRVGSVTLAGKTISISQQAAAYSGLTKTEISRLYIAIFGRASEGQGNAYWQSYPDMASAANAMLDTDTAKEYFGGGLNSNRAFIEHIYQNTLNKTNADDPAGIAYWTSLLDNGHSRGEVVAELVTVIESYAPGQMNHNKNDVPSVAAFNQFTNRVTVSDYMADNKFNVPVNLDDARFYENGLNVTDNVASIFSAKTSVDRMETLQPVDPIDPGNPGNPGEEYTNMLGMTFVKIPSGTFTMGSPEREEGRDADETVQVKIIEPGFYIQTTEVTQAQWAGVMGTNPSYFSGCGADCPVENVSWNDIQDFIARLNEQGQGTYWLPTEAEWEYAARAGYQGAFSAGGIAELFCGKDWVLDALGWYCGNSDNTTHPVAGKNANTWGLYDMHGNVSEWVFDPYPEPPTDHFIIRGGSLYSFAKDCRSAARESKRSDYRGPDIGFRLIYTPE